MEPSPDQFSRLKGLLRCKSHEQPPPGFFLDFSDRVIARIEAESYAPRFSWWQRLWAEIDPKPLLVSSYGVAVCAFMLFGLSLSQSTSEEGTGPLNPAGVSLMTVTSMTAEPDPPKSPNAFEFNRSPSDTRISSMNPVISTGSPAAVMDHFDHSRAPLQFQRASFTVTR